ncbi:MAG: hypothetical protein KDD38_09965 [Bdellovibrionales bacterium]|nr:hypothetical protein [Bdellovibrionales bacterium]
MKAINRYVYRVAQFTKRYKNQIMIFVSLGVVSMGFQNCAGDVKFEQLPTSSDRLGTPNSDQFAQPNGNFKINNGNIYTNNQGVALQITAEHTVGMLLTNDACPSLPHDPTQFETLQSAKNWLLSDKDGSSTVTLVLQGNGANNFSNCTSAEIVLDRKSPDARFIKTPNKMTNTDSASFDLKADDELSGTDKMYCRVSGQNAFTPCNVHLQIDALAEGTSTLSFYATDKAGNASPTIDYSWLVDLTPPKVTLIDPKPLALISTNSTMIHFIGEDGTGSGIAGYKCKLNGQDLATCVSPIILDQLADGQYVFTVTAVDNVGWISQPAVATFKVDTQPSGEFQVLGITGGADVKIDSYLTDLVTPILNWSTSVGAQNYKATILNESTTAVVCKDIMYAAGVSKGALGADCALNDNTKYVARMSAYRNDIETKAHDFKFLVDASAPTITIKNIIATDELNTANVQFSITDVGAGLHSATCYRVLDSDIRQDDCKNLSSIDYTNLAPGNYMFYIIATDNAGNSTQSTPMPFTLKNVVCNPFSPVPDPKCVKGLKANLFYASASDRALGNNTLGSMYNQVGKLIANGIKSNTIIYLPNLDVPLRTFTEGFGTSDGKIINDDSGKKLDEWFALEMTSYIKLSPTDAEGYYQLAIASDDGSNLYTDVNNTGVYKKIISNDGTHSNQLGCTTKGNEIYMTKETRIPIKIEYYQGPRTQIALSVFWRKVPAASSAISSNCGFVSSHQTSWFGSSTSPGMYNTLKNEGFTVLTQQNYISD